MKNEQQTWEATLLTPLHIGDGRLLQKDLDFVPGAKHTVLVVDIDDLLQKLKDDPRALHGIGRMGFDLPKLIKDFRLQPGGYHLSLRTNDTPREVRSFIKDAFGRPLVPGSSVKGAMRTALVTELISNGGIIPGANTGAIKTAVKKIGGEDPHHDFLRVLQVSDSAGVDPSCLALEEIKYFNLKSEHQAGWKDFSTRKNLDDFRAAQGTFVEAAKIGATFLIQMNLDGFLRREAVQKVSGLPPTPSLNGMEALAEAMNRHARRLIQREKEFFSRFGTTGAPIVRSLESIEGTILQRTPGSFILRLAWGSGWRGMTGDYLDDGTLNRVRKDENLGKVLCPSCGSDGKSLRFQKKRGTYRCNNCHRDFSAQDIALFPVFPKTRRLAMQDGVPSLPLGWVKFEPGDKNRFLRLTLGIESADGPRSVAPADEKQTGAARVDNTIPDDALNRKPVEKHSKREVWRKASLDWAPNTRTLNAVHAGKKAFSNEKLLAPEALRKALFEKRKVVKAVVEVEPIGNGFRIVSIRPEDEEVGQGQ